MLSRVEHRSQSIEWATPQALFNALQDEFGPFTLDPAATHENAKCQRYFTIAEDGLKQDWTGERVFCNPPYGRYITGSWVKKCATGGALIAVALLPSRTDTRWFHDHILEKAEIRFIKGRIKFGNAKYSAPFLSLIAIWRNNP